MRLGSSWRLTERTQGHSGRSHEAGKQLETDRKDTGTLRQKSRGWEAAGD